jgi:hypothetical protein
VKIPRLSGFGAVRVHDPSPEWRCPVCGRKPSKYDGCHVYADGVERCSTCAQAWVEAHNALEDLAEAGPAG